MNLISRVFRAANLKYALGEIGLIFVGISLALVANSWYGNLQDRREERELLTQILFDLRADIQAIDENISTVKEKLRLMELLRQHIESGQPYTSELDNAFRAILMVEGVSINSSSFETLTYRGIDLISESELRKQLVDYYDTEKSNLDRRNEFDFVDSMNAEPYFKKHFRWNHQHLSMKPLDYSALASDQEFLNILAVRIWAHRTHTMAEYTRVGQSAGDLASSIELHLGNLR